MNDSKSRAEFKSSIGVQWIKADSGNTYLCPLDALKRIDGSNEEQLKLYCVDESMNPHNE